jgi:hypothetical protein
LGSVQPICGRGFGVTRQRISALLRERDEQSPAS